MPKREATGNPQTEEGHTRIANELLDAINRTPLTDYERRLLGVVMRNVYGWHGRKDADISLKDFAVGADIDQRHVSRTLKMLLARNMITRVGSRTGIQKKYREWIRPGGTPHQVLPEQEGGDTSSGVTGDTSSGAGGTPEQAQEAAPDQAGAYRESKGKQEPKAKIKADAKASGAERPGDAGAGRVFPDGKPDPRNPAVTTILDTIKSTFDLQVLDGSEKKNRQAAWLLLGRLKKMSPAGVDAEAWALQLVTAVVLATKADPFWSNRLTSAITLNDKFMQIGKLAIARATGQPGATGGRRTSVFQG